MKISEFKDAVVKQVVMEEYFSDYDDADFEVIEAFVCKYCGVPCITEKAVNNYNIVNNNDIHDSVVNLELFMEQYLINPCSHRQECI